MAQQGKSGNPAKRAAAERARAEAMAALDDEESVVITLSGKDGTAKISVPPFLDWEDDAMACIRSADFRGWAESALDEDNFAKWCATRPTNRDSAKFLAAWESDSGEDLGESPASSES